MERLRKGVYDNGEGMVNLNQSVFEKALDRIEDEMEDDLEEEIDEIEDEEGDYEFEEEEEDIDALEREFVSDPSDDESNDDIEDSAQAISARKLFGLAAKRKLTALAANGDADSDDEEKKMQKKLLIKKLMVSQESAATDIVIAHADLNRIESLDELQDVLEKLPEIKLDESEIAENPGSDEKREQSANSESAFEPKKNKRLSAMVFGLKKTMSDWVSREPATGAAARKPTSPTLKVAGLKVDQKVKDEMDTMFNNLEIKVSL
ncbi:hypothetical protein HK100_002390 [Physocladia obscura]|uniref:Uncharacterized protein n=1 Tax=Physocladia obscura TaxID=109957 RepID=A0AAD5SXK1_9FUNG|nr:hypothetical protein HK100_002390 [Physocladia obscura]